MAVGAAFYAAVQGVQNMSKEDPIMCLTGSHVQCRIRTMEVQSKRDLLDLAVQFWH